MHSPGAWFRALDEHPDHAVLRADAARNVRRVARALARYTDWRTMTARPGWDLLVELTGLSRATVQRVLRRLRTWGLLGVVETGSTWRTRGGRPDDEDGNRAGEYVLCAPAVDESDPPSLLRQEERTEPRARACARWSMCEVPRTRRDQLAACERLRQGDMTLAKVSARRLRHLLRPFFTAGWTPADVRHALNHVPCGTPHWHTAAIRHLPGWLRYRLGLWRDTDGTPVVAPSRRRPVRATDLDPGDVAGVRRAILAAPDSARYAGLARSMLAASSPGARRIIERQRVV